MTRAQLPAGVPATCPICLNAYRRRIDTEILTLQDAGHSLRDVYESLTREFLPNNPEISIELEPDDLQRHVKKHSLLTVIGAKDVKNANIVQTAAGERIDVSDPKDVLMRVIGVGILNVLNDPTSVTPTVLNRAIELYSRLTVANSPLDELIAGLTERLKKGTPEGTTDFSKNQLAQEAPPVSKATKEPDTPE